MHPRDVCDGLAAGHGVKAAAAMHMQVDEAGQQQRQAVAARLCFTDSIARQGRDAALAALQTATHKAGRGQDVAHQRAGQR